MDAEESSGYSVQEFQKVVVDENGLRKFVGNDIVCNMVIDGKKKIMLMPIPVLVSNECVTEEDIELWKKEVDEYYAKESEKSNDGKATAAVRWTDGETKFLLGKMGDYFKSVGPGIAGKKFKNKKQMWQKISSDFKDEMKLARTWSQVESRYKTVRNAFDKARANNKETGTPRMDVPYESEFMRIVAMDDSIVPEVMRGVGEVVYPKKNLKDITNLSSTTSQSEDSQDDLFEPDNSLDSSSSSTHRAFEGGRKRPISAAKKLTEHFQEKKARADERLERDRAIQKRHEENMEATRKSQEIEQSKADMLKTYLSFMMNQKGGGE